MDYVYLSQTLQLSLHYAGEFLCLGIIEADQHFGPPRFPALILKKDVFKSVKSCYWRNINSIGTKIRFRLLYFDVPENEGCSTNHLKVYDGFHGAAPVIATLCGDIQQYEFESTQQSMMVELHTETFNTYRGFHGVFEVI